MSLAPQPSLYNQSRLDDADFVANFTARHDVLNLICRRLGAIGTSSDYLHQIIIGPRGMGKTSLLRRISIEIDRDEKWGNRFIPLGFREEQYNVLTLRDFWRNCGESLAEWADKHAMPGLAARLDAEMAAQGWDSDDGAAERFSAEMTALGRRAVLLVDNLDIIIDALTDEDRWTLRRSLQERSGPIVVGASTRPLSESGDREAAFYEFFEPHYLTPLTLDETVACLRALAQRRDTYGDHVQHILDTQPERIRTLHTLTGGNPRILSLIYRLLEAAESDATMADLETLLDQVTPYYKARIEEYQTPQQRATIDAIALHWDPVTTSTLSQITAIPSTTLSPLLIKLRKEGLIETVETSGAYSGHQLVERFLNIWYLMRHGTRRTKQRMRWLVAFLSNFYSPDDLRAINAHAVECGEAARWHKDYAFAFREAIMVQKQAPGDLSEKSKMGNLSGEETISTPQTGDGIGEALKSLRHLTQQAIDALLVRRTAEAIEACNAIITRFGDVTEPAVQPILASIMIARAHTLGKTGDRAAELAGYDTVIARYGEVAAPEAQQHVASAMVSRAITLGEAGERAAELAGYDTVIARYGEATALEVQRHVASAMFNRAVTLGEAGDRAAELAGYDAVIARYGEVAAPEVQQHVAQAMGSRAFTLGEMGDRAAELAGYDAVIARYGEATAPEVQKHVVHAMFSRAITLGETGDRAAKLAGYDAVIARYGEATASEAQQYVAQAMGGRAFTLGETGDRAAEIAGYDALIARYGEATAPEVQKYVAQAMGSRAITLGEMGDRAAALSGYDALIARYGEVTAPEVQKFVALAGWSKATILLHIGQTEAACDTYEFALQKLKHAQFDGAADLTEYAAITLANSCLDLLGDPARAEAALLEPTTRNRPIGKANLLWVKLFIGKRHEAEDLRPQIDDIPTVGLDLMDAALALSAENFGTAMPHLEAALSRDLQAAGWDFSGDRLRLFRLAEALGHGERLIDWFETSGFADRLAPLHAAFRAYVRGEKTLLDVNPEVRTPALEIFDALSAARRHQAAKSASGKQPTPRGRGRKRRAAAEVAPGKPV